MALHFVVSSDTMHLAVGSVTNTWADTREVLGGNGRARVLHSRTVLDVDLWSGLLSQGGLSHDTEKCAQVPGVKFGSFFWFRTGCLPACRSLCGMSCVILSCPPRSHLAGQSSTIPWPCCSRPSASSPLVVCPSTVLSCTFQQQRERVQERQQRSTRDGTCSSESE